MERTAGGVARGAGGVPEATVAGEAQQGGWQVPQLTQEGFFIEFAGPRQECEVKAGASELGGLFDACRWAGETQGAHWLVGATQQGHRALSTHRNLHVTEQLHSLGMKDAGVQYLPSNPSSTVLIWS